MFKAVTFLFLLAFVLLGRGVGAGALVGIAAFALLGGWIAWLCWQVLTAKPPQ